MDVLSEIAWLLVRLIIGFGILVLINEVFSKPLLTKLGEIMLLLIAISAKLDITNVKLEISSHQNLESNHGGDTTNTNINTNTTIGE